MARLPSKNCMSLEFSLLAHTRARFCNAGNMDLTFRPLEKT